MPVNGGQKQARHVYFTVASKYILPKFEFVSRQNDTNTQGHFYANFLTILLSFKSSKLSTFCCIGHCETVLVLMLLFDTGSKTLPEQDTVIVFFQHCFHSPINHTNPHKTASFRLHTTSLLQAMRSTGHMSDLIKHDALL